MNTVPEFTLFRPQTLNEALKIMKEYEAVPIAGGTDLIIDLRNGNRKVEHLVAIDHLGELSYIKEEGQYIRIGATTKHTHIVESNVIKNKASVLGDGVYKIGSGQTRNQGTIGGNICTASPGADAATPLLVLGATVVMTSTERKREVPLSDFFTGPKRNCLKTGELLTEVYFSIPPRGSGGAFQKLGRRQGATISLVNSAAYMELNEDICQNVRVAVGACAPTPVRIPDVEKQLLGKKISRDLIEEVSRACYLFVEPSQRKHSRASEEYRREMSCILMKRALMEAYEKARRN